MQWWHERTQREKAALVGLGGLLLVLCAVQFGMKPLVAYRLGAKTDFENAVALLAQVEADASEIEGLRSGAVARAHVEARTAVGLVASEQGLAITRLQPHENNDLDVWLDDVGSPALYKWITALQERYGISVARASIQKSEGGSVRAQITFAGGGAK